MARRKEAHGGGPFGVQNNVRYSGIIEVDG